MTKLTDNQPHDVAASNLAVCHIPPPLPSSNPLCHLIPLSLAVGCYRYKIYFIKTNIWTGAFLGSDSSCSKGSLAALALKHTKQGFMLHSSTPPCSTHLLKHLFVKQSLWNYHVFVLLLWVYACTWASWKICLTMVGIEPATFGLLVQCSTNWATWSSWFE